MGMYHYNNVIVGVQMNREQFQEEFGHPYEFDENREHDLIAEYGAEKQWQNVVVGIPVHQFDAQDMRATWPTDLVEEFKDYKKKTVKQLESVGIGAENISLFIVGGFR
jgi:hypothetical protein